MKTSQSVNGVLIRPRKVKITGFSLTRRAGQPSTWTNAHRLVRECPVGSHNIVTVHFTKGEAITSVSIYTSTTDRERIQAGPDHFRPDGSIGLNLVPLCSAMVILTTTGRCISVGARSEEETGTWSTWDGKLWHDQQVITNPHLL